MKKLTRAAAALITLVSASAGVHVASAQTDTYPSRPIRLVIAYAAGGPGDTVGRLVADRVSTELGQRIIVENRPGGNSVIGTDAVAKAEPDGYTVLKVTGAQVTVAHLQAVPFNFEKDLTPVIGIGSIPLVLTVPTAIKSIAELVALSKSTPGGINYGSSGVGTVAHLSGALFVQGSNINATAIHYKGGSPALQALMANQIQLFFATPLDVIELAKSGQLQLLAVTSDQRVSTLPNVPTMKELGLATNDARIWYGFHVPAKTPPPIVARLNQAFAKAMADPALQQRLQSLGFLTAVTDGPEFGTFVRTESLRWKKVIDDNKIKIEN